MYLNIGQNTFIDMREILMIVEKRQMCEMKQNCKVSNRHCGMDIDEIGCKSVIFLADGGVVFSTVAPSTLLKRSKRQTV